METSTIQPVPIIPTPEIKSPPLESKFRPSPYKKILTYLLVLLFLSVFILYGGIWGYLKYVKQMYSDSTYGFKIADQRGWYSVPKKEGVYYSIGTSDSSKGTVISYFGVSPINHTYSNNAISLENIRNSCSKTAQDLKTTLLDVSEVNINNLHGTVCISEGRAIKINKIYNFKQYFLINKSGKYDYILTVSYPKGNKLEEEKVNHILDEFYAL